MAEGADAEDRTEAPSQRRLDRARDEGQVPLSPELAALAVLGAAAVLLSMAAPAIGSALASRMGVMLEQAHATAPATALRGALGLAAAASVPFLLAAIAAAALATLLQTRFLLRAKALMPDLSRVSPMRGLGRVFGLASLGNAAKSVVKVAVVGAAAWTVMADALPALHQAAGWDAGTLAGHAAALVLRVLLAMLAAQAAIAVADILFAHIRHSRAMRMSRHDLREETREAEGDPHVKARIRRIRMQRARGRMLAEVPKATVVITNPTHYAVALAYARDSDAAPRIVAKGVDSMAARIREVAERNGVPLVANPPLARALYPHELDRPIPAELFQPVAEIIAYVWRLRGRGA